jgi:hypothetical protein
MNKQHDKPVFTPIGWVPYDAREKENRSRAFPLIPVKEGILYSFANDHFQALLSRGNSYSLFIPDWEVK